jgi:hypothetical protein
VAGVGTVLATCWGVTCARRRATTWPTSHGELRWPRVRRLRARYESLILVTPRVPPGVRRAGLPKAEPGAAPGSGGAQRSRLDSKNG